MVAVFAIFGSLGALEFKQLGVGLAVAILLDATIIRAVLLPATMKLLGDANWYLPEAAALATQNGPRARPGIAPERGEGRRAEPPRKAMRSRRGHPVTRVASALAQVPSAPARGASSSVPVTSGETPGVQAPRSLPRADRRARPGCARAVWPRRARSVRPAP